MAATQTVTLRERATLALSGVRAEAVVLAASFPVLFLHARYQPSFHLRAGGTTIGVELSDFAVLAVVVAAALVGVRSGFAPLRRGLPLWACVVAYLAWIGIEILIPHGTAGYRTAKHTVTAAKFAEYALLAPATVLLLRERVELRLVLRVVTAWSLVASAVGLAQFLGANIFVSGATGGRQLSFLGFHDFATLSSAALLLGVTAFVLPRPELGRRLAWAAAVAGAVGVVLSAALAAVVGIAAACAALAAAATARRGGDLRGVTVAGALVAFALVGAIAMRGSDLGQYLGLKKDPHEATHVESYAHRTVLAYIGYRIWRDHPVAGVGWEASGDPSQYLPYVPSARRRYPHEPPLAFPTAKRDYGIQNFYVQHLADLGVVGLALLASVFVAASSLAVRALGSTGALVGLLWTLAVAGLWVAQGIVAGLPLDALTWMAFGLAARG